MQLEDRNHICEEKYVPLASRIVRPERCHSFSELGQIWIGVMGGFLADIESHRFKGYPIP
jgi:hypothetical protein